MPAAYGRRLVGDRLARTGGRDRDPRVSWKLVGTRSTDANLGGVIGSAPGDRKRGEQSAVRVVSCHRFLIGVCLMFDVEDAENDVVGRTVVVDDPYLLHIGTVHPCPIPCGRRLSRSATEKAHTAVEVLEPPRPRRVIRGGKRGSCCVANGNFSSATSSASSAAGAAPASEGADADGRAGVNAKLNESDLGMRRRGGLGWTCSE